MINAKDNLNRTSFHYACIMNDKTSIEMLEQANARQVKFDSFLFCG
jgi:ankyrin repeat protein